MTDFSGIVVTYLLATLVIKVTSKIKYNGVRFDAFRRVEHGADGC